MIRKTTWLILLTFAVLLAAAFLWQRSQDQKAANATPTVSDAAVGSENLFDVQGEITGLRIEHVGDKAVDLARDETGQWVLSGEPPTVLDSAAIDSVVGGLSALPVVSRLQSPPELEALGLNPPAYRLLVTLKNGDQLIASVGKVTPTGSGFYVLSGDRRLLIVSQNSLQTVLDLVDNPPYPPTPYPLPADLTPGAQPAIPTGSSMP
jgi:Domain of unknown function (DUF4340)